MKIKFEKGEKGQLLLLSDLKIQGSTVGKRTFGKAPISYNNTWNLAWYEPGAWSTPHYHEGCESVYNFSFKEDKGCARVYLGWPLSEAKIFEIKENALCYIPSYEIHCFVNIGNTEMRLIYAFSPPWEKDLNVKLNLTDAETQKKYTDPKEYAEYIKRGDEKYGSFDNYIKHLKDIKKY